MASSVEQEAGTSADAPDAGDTKQKRGFQPLKSMRKFFSRKPQKSGEKKSKSTSQLDAVPAESAYHKPSAGASGLSRSHDDVFAASHAETEKLGIAAVSMEVLPQAGRPWNVSMDSEDEGLPHSPYNVSSTSDVPNPPESRTKSASKAYSSDNSLLSISSLDEDESQEQPGIDFDTDASQVKSLSSAAARHKIAIRPQQRRRPRFKPIPEDPLPPTPELPEDAAEDASPTTTCAPLVVTTTTPEPKPREKKSTFAGVKRKLSRRDKEHKPRKILETSSTTKKDDSPGFFARMKRSLQRKSTRESKSAPNSPTRGTDKPPDAAAKHRSASQLEGLPSPVESGALALAYDEKVTSKPPIAGIHFTKRGEGYRAADDAGSPTTKQPKTYKRSVSKDAQTPDARHLQPGKKSDDIRRTKSERISRERSPAAAAAGQDTAAAPASKLSRDAKALSMSELAVEAAERGGHVLRPRDAVASAQRGDDADDSESEFSKAVAGITKRVDATKLESLEKKRQSGSEAEEGAGEALPRVVLRKTRRAEQLVESHVECPPSPPPIFQPSPPKLKHRPSPPQPQHQPSLPQPKHQPSLLKPKFQPSPAQPKFQPSPPQQKHQPSPPQPKRRPSPPPPKRPPSPPQAKHPPSPQWKPPRPSAQKPRPASHKPESIIPKPAHRVPEHAPTSEIAGIPKRNSAEVEILRKAPATNDRASSREALPVASSREAAPLASSNSVKSSHADSFLSEVMFELSSSPTVEQPSCQSPSPELANSWTRPEKNVDIVIVDKERRPVPDETPPRPARSRTLPGVDAADVERAQAVIAAAKRADAGRERSHTQPVSEGDVARAERTLRAPDADAVAATTVRAAASRAPPRKLELREGVAGSGGDEAPSWVVLAQRKHERYSIDGQENELRDGTSAPAALEPEQKAAAKAEVTDNRRSSRVLEMVNNFQKLQ